MLTNVTAKFDDVEIPVSKRFEAALIELMKAECEMMQKCSLLEGDCWVWGRCDVNDLSDGFGIQLTFGAKEDHPGGPDFLVIYKEEDNEL